MSTLQQVLAIAAPLAIVFGVIVAVVQLRSQRIVRQVEIAMRLYSTFGEDTFVRHFYRVTTWDYPTYAAYQAVSSMDDYTSLMVVSVFFESMGLLLKRGYAPIELLDDLLSGPVLAAWPKVAAIWIGMREEYGQPSWSEWFEYFHDAMAARG